MSKCTYNMNTCTDTAVAAVLSGMVELALFSVGTLFSLMPACWQFYGIVPNVVLCTCRKLKRYSNLALLTIKTKETSNWSVSNVIGRSFKVL